MTRRKKTARSLIAAFAAGAAALSGIGAMTPALAADEPTTGLIAEYTFDDGTLADSVGTADLTVSGTAAVSSDAVKSSALHLDGSAGGFAAFPQGFFDGRDTMTVSMDLKSDLTSGNFFSFAFGQDQNRYYFLRTRGADVRSAITSASWQAESAVTGAVTAGQWHHYDLVFEGRTMTVYVDGAKLGENTALTAGVGDLGSNLVGYLGKSLYSADRCFSGWFDNVRVYDRALSAQEVIGADQLVNLSLTDPSLLKTTPIVDGAAHTAMLPVNKGSDVTALAPTFEAADGVTVSPASGTVVDLSTPVTYTLTAPGGGTAEWTISAQVVGSPVLPGLYADPNIAVFGDTYYIYATTDGFAGWGGNEFYVWTSKNLVDWTRSAEPFLTLDGVDGDVPWASGNAWAPTIIERDGKYYFYFSGHNPTYNRKTIGVAVADSPEGPFVAEPQAMILNNEIVTTGQAIDPAAFRDPQTGRYHLIWGNGGGGAVLGDLSEDMRSVGNLRRVTGLTDFREGAFLNYRDGLYHLTYAIDDTGSENYRVGYATATSINGLWTYRGVILEKDLSLGIKGPGHSSIINVPGTDDWYIAYHRFAIPGGDGTHRETTIDRLAFGADGLIQKVTPTLTSVAAQEISVPADVATTVTSRCVAGRASLVVTARNDGEGAAHATIRTAYGDRTLALDPGRTASASFSTRLASAPAGEVVTEATPVAGGETVTTTTAYAAKTCG